MAGSLIRKTPFREKQTLWTVLFFFFIFPKTIFSQSISIQHYSVNDGLPQGSVYAIYQANNGVMWFGTGDGLCSYDGARYTVFRKNIVDGSGLLHNRIKKIGEDKTGNIYINSDVGLNMVEAFSGKITTPAVPNYSKSDSLFFLFASGNNVYLVKNRMQLWCYHSERKTFEKKANLAYGISVPHQVYAMGDEIYYCHPQNTLIAFNYKTLKSRSIATSLIIRSIFGQKGELIVNTTSGIYRLSKDRASLLPVIPEMSLYIQAFSLDNLGNFWLANKEKGLMVYDRNGKSLYQFPPDFQKQKFDGMSLKDVQTFYTDRSGNTWIGTEGNGIAKFNLSSGKFEHVNNDPENKDGLSTGFMKCFYRSYEAGKVLAGLWVGTHLGGIHFRKPGSSFIRFGEMKTCFGLVQDNEGNLWAASDSGIFIMDKNRGHFRLFRNFLRGYSIRKLVNGNLLYSDVKGTYIISPDKTNVFKSVVKPFKGCPADVLVFFETRNGDVIMSVEQDGIFISRKFSSAKKVGPKTILDKLTVRCIHESVNGWFYLAANIGLIVLDENLAIKKIYSVKDGLPNEVLYSVIPDGQNNLWISSNKGISRFNMDSETFRNYTVDDGIQSNEFNTGAWYIDPIDSFIYMGGVNGYNVFKPIDVKDNSNTPNVVLSGLKIFDKDFISDTVLHRKKSIDLLYNQNALTFEFTAPEFTKYDKNNYAYKLEGVDADWVMAGKRRYATYGNLAAGNYVLKAKASNNDGVWGEERMLLSINIHPPWWRTAWFNVLSGTLLLFFIGFLMYRISTVRLRKQLAEMKRLQEIEAVRSRISRDIHDDVGAGLSHLALSSDLALMKLGKDSEMSDQLRDLSANSRKLIDSLGEIIWSVNPRFDDWNSLFSYMRSYISEYMEKAEINVQTEIPETLPDRQIKPEIRRNIFLILKECLHNIVKHADAKNVRVVFEISNEKYELSISDDGKGIDSGEISDPMAGGFGNGLINMKRRAEEMQCTLSVESKSRKGTRVTLIGTIM